MSATAPRVLTPEERSSWARVRRYAVPRQMIERATERRLAGDWRGACAAANVDVAFDPAEVARTHGAEVAAALEDDLLHLAPELARWHLPRILGGRSTLATHQAVILADHDQAGGAVLRLRTPTMADGSQRLTLAFGRMRSKEGSAAEFPFGARYSWARSRHLWDARRTDELRERWGGGDRTPFFRPDGTPLGAAELPAADPGPGDPVARTEWVSLLHGRGEVEAAFAAAGIDLDPTPLDLGRYYNKKIDPLPVLTALPLALTRLAAEAELLGADRLVIPHGWRYSVLIDARDGRPRLKLIRREGAGDAPIAPASSWRRPVDLDLLREGVLTPERLHPLIRAALFPARPADAGPAGPPDPEASPVPVRVRCRGEWHEVAPGGDGLTMPHTAEEQRREQALQALGGEISGCFAVQRAWRGGGRWLPKGLRAQRRELFNRVQHGDAPGVLALLDAGISPHVRDGRQRSLLHLLHLVDHEALLPRLLAAGLDLEAEDHHQRTPLHVAVGDGGSTALVRALLDAGARIDVLDHQEWSLSNLIRRHRRTDLKFLDERLQRECPDVGHEWYDAYDEEQDEDDEDDE
ncbi:ankyrin repeat domain-containing protein [Actinomadura craniellae]|uniref:Ankyrin repeat domain-containing protein n=1 Tax=Actinomadura craniellae TaxID=2231787 RepID=A0A365HC97_9ACTN|nr:ankyrin repeat domain-containing protein [Actinomadura craniellae]RAY16721.1 ankyrin repeat domain-containing protein [Actinomadura craniellae]